MKVKLAPPVVTADRTVEFRPGLEDNSLAGLWLAKLSVVLMDKSRLAEGNVTVQGLDCAG